MPRYAPTAIRFILGFLEERGRASLEEIADAAARFDDGPSKNTSSHLDFRLIEDKLPKLRDDGWLTASGTGEDVYTLA